MKQSDKESFVVEFKAKLEQAPVLFLTNFSGLDVKSMTKLRRQLRETGAEYIVVKNRLVVRAMQELDIDLTGISDHLKGPTGVVLGTQGPVEPAKILTEFAKVHQDRPVFKVGRLDEKVVEASQFQRLAKLPPREELLAQLAGALQAPMAAFVSVLQGKLQETAGLVEALRQKRESEGA
jgi:large subunit ribosomal protein L10